MKKKKKSKKNREGRGGKRRSRREVTLERALVKVCTVMDCAPFPPPNCISKKISMNLWSYAVVFNY